MDRVGPGRGAAAGAAAPSAAGWKVENGYMEVTPGVGGLTSKERFKDFQLHVEFASPAVPLGISQYRGNSGISIGGREIQVLDNYNNATYADGYVAAVYNQWPPLANPSRPPGEWQTLDIAYMAARYDGDRLVRNAFITIFMNGVMVHNNREIQPRGGGPGQGAAGRVGGAGGRGPTIPPGADQPVSLSGHPSAIPGNAVRYRNVWARRVEVELPSASSAAPAGGLAARSFQRRSPAMNRREFIHLTAGVAVAASAGPRLAAQAQRTGSLGANERVRSRSSDRVAAATRCSRPFRKRRTTPSWPPVMCSRSGSTPLSSASPSDGTKVDGYEDYRRVLDRQDIDAVLIATPDHWHPQLTIDAVAAGKDVYVEKPTSNAATLPTAAKALEVVRRSNRIVEVGTQQRSWPHFADAKALLPQLGGVTHVVLQYGGPGSPVVEPVVPVPAGLNWDLFQGPAPKKPYKTGRQRQWRNYWDYGGGTVTDWGVHLVDTALWFMDAQLKAPKWPWAWVSTSTSRTPIRSARLTRSPRAGNTTAS